MHAAPVRRLYCQPVPKHDAFNRAFTRLTPATMQSVNALLVSAAVAVGLEDGSKLRVDTTVVQTDIHHPTDNTLLWDVVRVLTRLIGRLAKAIGRRIKGFRNRTRAARRRMQALQRMTTTQRLGQQTGKYRELIGIAVEVVERARGVLRHTGKVRGKDLLSHLAIEDLRRRGRSLLCAGGARDRSSGPPRSGRRASSQRREDLFNIRASHGSDQARQGANPY